MNKYKIKKNIKRIICERMNNRKSDKQRIYNNNHRSFYNRMTEYNFP